MSWKTEIGQLFDALKQARDALIEASKSREEGWQARYGRVRQDLRSSIAALEARAAELARSQPDQKIADYHTAVSGFRKVLENHHARWPVLIIKDRGPDYAKSMAAVDEGFMELMRLTGRL